jgi:hypothetical protein
MSVSRPCSSLNVQGGLPALTTEDKVAAANRKAITREQDIPTQMDAVFTQIREMEAQKQPLLRRLPACLDAEQAIESATARSR